MPRPPAPAATPDAARASTSEWELRPRDATTDGVAVAPRGALAQFARDLADHKAWWLVPAVVTLAALLLLLFLARGDLTVPAIYRLF